MTRQELLKQVVEVQVSSTHKVIGECKSITRSGFGYRVIVGNHGITLLNLSKIKLYEGGH